MSDQDDTTTEETETVTEAEPTTEQAPPKPTETVEFWKAMSRKNEDAAKELEKLKAAQLSKEERAAKEAADARAEAEQAKAEAMRWRIAARFGMSDQDAELFLTGHDEDTLTRQAQRFTELTPKIGKGNVVPGVGNIPAQPPTLAEQIRAAEQSGDTKLALSLKNQQLAELAAKR